jgi:hypothetical protein
MVLAVLLAMTAAGQAGARDALGVFGKWGAFRDADKGRCFAIARPASLARPMQGWRPFASVATWPRAGVGNQLHIRLSRARRADTPLTLSVDGRRFTLVTAGPEAWAPDARSDAAIVAAMRSARTMIASGRDQDGNRIADVYPLQGAATAIDAATLGCARAVR